MRVRSVATLLALILLSCETPSQSSEAEPSALGSSDVEGEAADDTRAQADKAPATGAAKSEASRPSTSKLDAGNGTRSLVDAGSINKQLEGGDAAATSVGSGIPCAVLEVVSTHCLRCHGEEPQSPLSLTTREHFVAPPANDPSGHVYERVKQRIHDAEKPMPPRATQDKLTALELETLDAWLDAGAPRSVEACQGGAADAGAAPADPVIDRSECEFEVDLRANNGERSDDSAFPIPKGEELYECFNFDIPWQDTAHALTFEPLIDNRGVLHHWSLFAIEEKLPSGKRPGKCDTGTRAGLAAWAPGDRPTVLPEDVGVRISSGKVATFQLEIHYNNLTGATDQQDRSGVHICATTTKRRQHEAVPVIFGPLCFGAFCEGLPPGRSEVSNTCLNLSDKGPAHVLWSSPHMHRLGRHMKTVINRADGGVETLVDVDFDFDDQRDYPSDKIIYAGDSLTTTCTFENDSKSYVEWGESTNNEMCFNFLMVYPPQSISSIEGFCTGLL